MSCGFCGLKVQNIELSSILYILLPIFKLIDDKLLNFKYQLLDGTDSEEAIAFFPFLKLLHELGYLLYMLTFLKFRCFLSFAIKGAVKFIIAIWVG